jgi:hypothetical protein
MTRDANHDPDDALQGVVLPGRQTRLAAVLLTLYMYSQEPDAAAGLPRSVLATETDCAPNQTHVNLTILRGRGLTSSRRGSGETRHWWLTDLGVAAVWRLFGTGPTWVTLRELVRTLGPVRSRPRTAG